MGQILQVNILIYSLATMLLLEVMNCEATIAISSSISTQHGTSCDGLTCPPNTNCMAHNSNVNGNSTIDKRCMTNNGVVVRQETVTIANGQECVKNLTTIHNKVYVDKKCRKLSNQEKTFYNQESHNQAQAAMDYAFEQNQQNQEALDDIISRQEEYMDRFNENMFNEKEKNIMAHKYRQKLLELTKQQLEKALGGRLAAWEKYVDNVEEHRDELDIQKEAKLLKYEKARELLERRAELLEKQRELQELQMEKALEAMELYGNGRNLRNPRWRK